MVFESILPYLVSAVTGVVGWLAGLQKRKNDFLNEMQKSIDLLSKENSELLSELVLLRKENAFLVSNQEKMRLEISQLRKENGELRMEVEELNSRLANVKTITRKA